MNSKIKIYKIKNDSVEDLKNWGSALMGELLIRAVDSLKEENCIFEEARIFSIEGQFYLVGMMVSKPNLSLVKGPDSEINLKHRAIIKDAILEEVGSEVLYKIL